MLHFLYILHKTLVYKRLEKKRTHKMQMFIKLPADCHYLVSVAVEHKVDFE